MVDQRLTWLTRRPTVWSAVVPLVAIGAGILFATSAATARGTDLRSSAGDLPGVIREQTRDNALAAERLARLRAEVDTLSARQAPGDQQLQAVTARADELVLAAGTQAVRGPALRVSMTDAPSVPDELPGNATLDDYVVHQQDVQAVVNALWRGGAESMMLMDQRVISTSAVRCVGNTLILQGRVYSPPYVITAIGDRDRMEQSLRDDEAVDLFRQAADLLGLGYDVSRLDAETFPAYSGSLTLEDAQAAR